MLLQALAAHPRLFVCENSQKIAEIFGARGSFIRNASDRLKSSHVAVTIRSGRVVEEDVEEEEEVESDPIAPVDEGEGVSPSDDGGYPHLNLQQT